MNWHLRVCSVWDSTQECNDTRHKKNVEEANVVECERRKWKKSVSTRESEKKSKCLHIRKEEKEFQARILKTSCMSQCTSISTHVSVFHACRITFFYFKSISHSCMKVDTTLVSDTRKVRLYYNLICFKI